MGVSALFYSAVSGIADFLEDVEFVVFDNGLGLREESLRLPSGKDTRLLRFGARGGRRYHRPENIASMLLTSRMGKLGAKLSKAIKLIDSCDAVLDVSGGDSFSDIYGIGRFNNIYRPKAVAINRGKPLILLPQTYGPYMDPEVRTLAASVTRAATMAWARDEHSYTILQDLLAERFDPRAHLCGVDMAFGLPARPAAELLPPVLRQWLNERATESPLVGFNVSGLIYNDPAAARAKYGFKADYQAVIWGFLNKVLAETRSKVVLIPHVMDTPGHFESDLAACLDVIQKIGSPYSGRIVVSPCIVDPTQVKWLIGQMDWFCGTRMHATIAALSSGVPTAAVSYSDKTKGVFETCGQGGQVKDPRQLSSEAIVDGLSDSFFQRASVQKSLNQLLPAVRQMSNQQFRMVAEVIQGRYSQIGGATVDTRTTIR